MSKKTRKSKSPPPALVDTRLDHIEVRCLLSELKHAKLSRETAIKALLGVIHWDDLREEQVEHVLEFVIHELAESPANLEVWREQIVEERKHARITAKAARLRGALAEKVESPSLVEHMVDAFVKHAGRYDA